MTEYQIEIAVEQWMDKIDSQLMRHQITQEEYENIVKQINQWVKEQTE
jgi:hypothetical protein